MCLTCFFYHIKFPKMEAIHSPSFQIMWLYTFLSSFYHLIFLFWETGSAALQSNNRFTYIQSNTMGLTTIENWTSLWADPREYRLAATPLLWEWSTPEPPRAVCSAPLLTLYTHDCTPRHEEKSVVNYVDTTTIISEYISRGNQHSCKVVHREPSSQQNQF